MNQYLFLERFFIAFLGLTGAIVFIGVLIWISTYLDDKYGEWAMWIWWIFWGIVGMSIIIAATTGSKVKG